MLQIVSIGFYKIFDLMVMHWFTCSYSKCISYVCNSVVQMECLVLQ